MYATTSNTFKQSRPTAPPQGRGLSVQELKAMTAMRLSQDNNETQGVNRNRPTEMGQHSTNTRSYQPTNGVMPSGHDRAKASSSNAGLSVQDVKELTKLRLAKLHASSSDSGDLRFETESNHSGASFKGLLSGASLHYALPGRSGTATPDTESLIDDADLPYYNQLHTQQVQRHIGGLMHTQKKAHELQPQTTVSVPKQSYSSAKQINNFVPLPQSMQTLQGNPPALEYVRSNYAPSTQVYQRSNSSTGVSFNPTLENGRPRGLGPGTSTERVTYDPQAYVQQLASKISSHLTQQQFQPPLQTTTQSHLAPANSNGIAAMQGDFIYSGLGESRPGSNSSSYYGGFKLDGSMHGTEGNNLNNLHAQKFTGSSFSDRVSKTTSEDSYYSNPSTSHVVFGGSSLQYHRPLGASQQLSTSLEEKSSYLNDYFDTSRSTGSDEFNFATGAIRDVMEGIGSSNIGGAEQTDASSFHHSTNRFQGHIEEQLMRTKQHADDQLLSSQLRSKFLALQQDSSIHPDDGTSIEAANTMSKTPFGGLRKKTQSERVINPIAFGGSLFSDPDSIVVPGLPQLDVSGITLAHPTALSSVALVSPVSRSRASSSNAQPFADSSPPGSPKSMKHKSKLPLPFPASLRSRSTTDPANAPFEIVESVLNALTDSMSPNGSTGNTPSAWAKREESPGARYSSHANYLVSTDRLYLDASNVSPALSPDKLRSTMSL